MSHAILVLEDDTNMREILVETLEDEGHEVAGAGSASEALEISRQRQFDLVVADVRMAGMDGIDCLGALKQRYPDLRSVVITGYANDDAPFRAISIEVDDYIFKPFELKAFQRVVRRVLGAGQEKASYADLLTGFMAGYRKLVRRAGEALANSQLNAMEQDRDRLFSHFFVAVRSAVLLPGNALKVWDQLEALETARDAIKDNTSVDAQKLRDGYRYIADLVEAMGRSGINEPAGPRAEGQIPKETFSELYSRLKGGDISLEQLKLAPLLRTMDPRELQASAKLWTLHREIFGDAQASA